MSTNNNEVIIIAEETNGETTVVEIIAADADTLLAKDGDGDTIVEEIIEAVFDHTDDADTDDAINENLDVADAEVITTSNVITDSNEDEPVLGSTDEFDAAFSEFNPHPDLDSAFDPQAPAGFEAPGISET